MQPHPPMEAISPAQGQAHAIAERQTVGLRIAALGSAASDDLRWSSGSNPPQPTMHRVNVRFHFPTKDEPGRTLSLLSWIILRGAPPVTDQFRPTHEGVQGTLWPAPTRALINQRLILADHLPQSRRLGEITAPLGGGSVHLPPSGINTVRRMQCGSSASSTVYSTCTRSSTTPTASTSLGGVCCCGWEGDVDMTGRFY